MATNVNVYVPNQGEKEALRAIIKSKALVLFLYKNAVIGEGALVFESLTEWTEGGGGTYARKELSIDLVEDAVAVRNHLLAATASTWWKMPWLRASGFSPRTPWAGPRASTTMRSSPGASTPWT